MLPDRIISTLRFFDLQDTPLTLFEIHKFLLADAEELRPSVNEKFEFIGPDHYAPPIFLGEVAVGLQELVSANQVEMIQGYYCLPARSGIINDRLQNYSQGIQRERRIRKYAGALRHIPFIRGMGIGGSQALGQQTANSDIDIFIITDSKFLWLARTLGTAYFHIFGVRRHGKKIANRFCLNHYVAGAHELADERDPYNAMEYLRLRAIVQPAEITKFKKQNLAWIRKFYSNAFLDDVALRRQSWIQKFCEWLLNNFFGRWLETQLGARQLPRIKTGDYAVATNRELSFHSKERKYKLLRQFFAS